MTMHCLLTRCDGENKNPHYANPPLRVLSGRATPAFSSRAILNRTLIHFKVKRQQLYREPLVC